MTIASWSFLCPVMYRIYFTKFYFCCVYSMDASLNNESSPFVLGHTEYFDLTEALICFLSLHVSWPYFSTQ